MFNNFNEKIILKKTKKRKINSYKLKEITDQNYNRNHYL